MGLKTGQRSDVQAKVATFPRGIISTSRRCRGVYFQSRDVGVQHRDITE